MTAPPVTDSDSAPLFITGDPPVAAQLRKLAVTAGVDAHLVATVEAAGRYWRSAGSVVIGADVAVDCAQARPPARSGVIVLTDDRLPLDRAWQVALALGADQVVNLPAATPWLVRRLAGQAAAGAGRVLWVTGSRGGAGTSTLSCGLGVAAAARGVGTLLVDTDIDGGGLDLVLGWERLDGARWSDLAAQSDPFDGERLRARLPGQDGLQVLSFCRRRPAVVSRQAMQTLIGTARRHFGLVVVDVSRPGPVDLADSVGDHDRVVVVVPAEVRAASAARLFVERLAGLRDRVRLVLRGPSPSRIAAADIKAVVGLPVAAELRTDPRLGAAAESGGVASRARHGNLAEVSRTLLSGLIPAERSA